MARFVIYSTFGLLLISWSTFFNVYIESNEHILDEPDEIQVTIHSDITESQSTDIFFVGDIMLGRAVETFMTKRGTGTPFEYTKMFLREAALTVGNFEGVVNEVHEHTPNMTFRFSVPEKYLEELSLQGFDILSLSNNHSLDYGASSLSHTRILCATYDLVCGGSPLNEEKHLTRVVESGGVRIGILFLHTLFGEVSTTTLTRVIEELKDVSDVSIAYVHWGDEYMLTHSEDQRKLGHALIEYGIDAVIGHHPHVVQDIEMYNGKPIFYSLGNFIFDQYFTVDVQEMIGIHMNISDTHITYSIHPFTTVHAHMQPQPLQGERKSALYTRIFATQYTQREVIIGEGKIVVPR